ncbi:hypothetical protein [Spiroplasma culicicola]|uniref:Transmembrane protein n=1 Tax=Spiroplasma culicicola AES-1 TaxID=1276246 RepID=W6A8L6_9MOLU|nr:hypothetical protein [Spiroplasma culicicola]AHI53362.1 hypothetical protein SCULI_v1c10220 [Spiroplasma culicicola AES-1]
MFILLIVLAWSIVMVAALFLLTFAALSLTATLWFEKAAGTQNFLFKLFDWMSSQPYSIPWFGAGAGGAPNNWVITPTLLMMIKGGAIPQWHLFVTAGLMVALSAGLITVAVMELVRAKKRQKISKPFIKSLLVLVPAFGLLYGQNIILIVSGCLLVAWVLLEAVLFDSEALNNYAEERNLISIYKEERKFEKEVSKEGKLTGNVDSETTNQGNQKNMLDQNGKAKINDNSALPKKSKSPKWQAKYEKYNGYKAELAKFRLGLQMKAPTLTPEQKAEYTKKFNAKVKKLNFFGWILGLNKSHKIPYLVLPNTSVQTAQSGSAQAEPQFNNPKAKKAYLQWKTYRDQLEALRADLQSKAAWMTSVQKEKATNKFNFKVMKVNGLSKKLKLPEEFNIAYLVLEGSGQTVQNNVQQQTSQPQVAPVTPTPSAPTMEANFQTGSIDEATAAFGGQSSTAVDPNIEDLHERYSGGNKPGVPQTFVAPQTTVHGTRVSKQELDAQLQAKLAFAINMDPSQLPASSQAPDTDKNAIYADMNFKQPDLLFQVAMKAAAKQKEREKRAAANGTTAVATVSAPPTFGGMTFDEVLQDDRIVENIEEMKLPETFVAPQTKVHGTTTVSKSQLDAELQARLAYAINMDVNQLPAIAEPANADKTLIYTDLSFKQPDLLFQVAMKAAAKQKEREKRAAANGTTAVATVSAPPTFGGMTFDEMLQDNRVVENVEEMKFGEMPSTQSTAPSAPTPSFEAPIPSAPVAPAPSFEAPAPAPAPIAAPAVDNQKLNEMEDRMARLESAISSLGNSNTEALQQQFQAIAQQLESITRTVNEMEAKNPRAIIDSLTTKYAYNQK